jgi:hypothetical protein
MKLNEAKEQFVSTWGALGTNWGINGTMARIHALLLTSDEPLTTEDVMEQLKNKPWKCQHEYPRFNGLGIGFQGDYLR